MTIFVRFGPNEIALLEERLWTCPASPDLADLLNAYREDWDPGPSHYWPDLKIAEEAAKKFKGEIIRKSERPPKRDDEDIVY